MNNLTEIFTKKNLEVLDLIRKEKLCIRDIAEKLKCSPGKVHASIKLFKKNNLIKEEKIKNKIIVSLNYKSILLSKITSLINTNKIMNSIVYNKLDLFGVYGSFAKGTNDKDSDIDLWVYTEKKGMDIIKLTRKLEKELESKVNAIVLNKEKIRLLKKKDPEFYNRLKFTSISFRGDVFG